MKIKFETIIQLFFISAVLGVSVSYSKLYMFHILLFILVSSFMYIKINGFEITVLKLPTNLHYIFYVMLFWYILSLNWSINYSYTMKYLFYIVCGLSIVLTMIYYLKDLEIQKKLFKILSIVFIVEIIFSLLEAFTDFRLPISPYSSYLTYFGREIKIGDLNDNVISYLMQSPTGFQWNPNNLSITMLIISPFFLLYKNTKIRYIGLLSILLIIIMASSRGAFIAFLFMLFLYIFLFNKKRFLIHSLITTLVFILFLVNLDSLKNSENERVKDISNSFSTLLVYLYDNTATNATDSIGVRKELVTNGLNALEKSNYLGVGGGGSVAVQENLGGVGTDGKLTSMHNFCIELLVEGGILFILVFISWYLYIVIKLYSISLHTKNTLLRYYSQSLFLSMTSFIIGAVSASSVIYLFPMWIMFGFSIATINNYERYKNETFTAV